MKHAAAAGVALCAVVVGVIPVCRVARSAVSCCCDRMRLCWCRLFVSMRALEGVFHLHDPAPCVAAHALGAWAHLAGHLLCQVSLCCGNACFRAFVGSRELIGCFVVMGKGGPHLEGMHWLLACTDRTGIAAAVITPQIVHKAASMPACSRQQVPTTMPWRNPKLHATATYAWPPCSSTLQPCTLQVSVVCAAVVAQSHNQFTRRHKSPY